MPLHIYFLSEPWIPAAKDTEMKGWPWLHTFLSFSGVHPGLPGRQPCCIRGLGHVPAPPSRAAQCGWSPGPWLPVSPRDPTWAQGSLELSSICCLGSFAISEGPSLPLGLSSSRLKAQAASESPDHLTLPPVVSLNLLRPWILFIANIWSCFLSYPHMKLITESPTCDNFKK